jgi:hypothetical protein
VLIDPEPRFAFDPKNEEKLEMFRGLIWQVYVSWELPLGSQYQNQAHRGAAERVRTTTLSTVQGGAPVCFDS